MLSVTISQENYTHELLEKFRLKTLKAKANPMANGVKLDANEKLDIKMNGRAVVDRVYFFVLA